MPTTEAQPRMSNAEALGFMKGVAAQMRSDGQLDKAAGVELAAEYLTNPQFRAGLQDYIWRLSQEPRGCPMPGACSCGPSAAEVAA